MRRRRFLLVAPFALLAATAVADDGWTETRSAHLTVVSNAGRDRAEATAVFLERVRAHVAARWTWARLDGGVPWVVYLPKDAATLETLVPWMADLPEPQRPLALHLVLIDRSVSVLRGDDERRSRAEMLHELAHQWLNQSLVWLPVWAHEGLAMQQARIVAAGDGLALGPPPASADRALAGPRPLPLKTIWAVDEASPFFEQHSRSSIFAAQCLAIVDVLSRDGSPDSRLDDYLQRLRRGTPEAEARVALGSEVALEKALAGWETSRATTGRLTAPRASGEQPSVETSDLSPGMLRIAQADLLVRVGRPAEAQIALAEVRTLDPTLVEALDLAAMIAFNPQKPESARAEVERAVNAGSQSFFTWYLAGLARADGGKPSAASIEALRRSVGLNPRFAWALAVLAACLSERGESPEEATALALRVRDEWPSNVTSQLMAAGVLKQLERIDEARAIAEGLKRSLPAGPYREAAEKFLAEALPTDPAKRLAFHLARCNSGQASDCSEAGRRYARGDGVARDDPRSVALFEKACGLGDTFGCTWLGWQLQQGRGAPKDVARAKVLLHQACESGSAWACGRLGMLHYEGKDAPRDYSSAAPLLEKGCEQGEGWVCSAAGWIREEGKAGPADPARAVALFELGCDDGDADSCDRFAWMLQDGTGIAKDEARAVAVHEKACGLGRAASCAAAAYRYKRGRGVPVDLTRVASLYQKACQLKHAASCTSLGHIYLSGEGTSKDAGRAVELFLSGCDGGDGYGCVSLGVAYRRGEGVAADPKRALELFERGCAASEPECSELAKALAAGVFAPPDYPRAASLYEGECQREDGYSCAALAAAYDVGIGVPRDEGKATELRTRACSLGYKRACGESLLSDEEFETMLQDARKVCDAGLAISCSMVGIELLGKDRAIEALPYFEKACGAGHPLSCAQVATAHLLGRGVPQDAGKAKALFEKACDAGEPSACEALRLTR
jgi:TPR repeat protein